MRSSFVYIGRIMAEMLWAHKQITETQEKSSKSEVIWIVCA